MSIGRDDSSEGGSKLIFLPPPLNTLTHSASTPTNHKHQYQHQRQHHPAPTKAQVDHSLFHSNTTLAPPRNSQQRTTTSRCPLRLPRSDISRNSADTPILETVFVVLLHIRLVLSLLAIVVLAASRPCHRSSSLTSPPPITKQHHTRIHCHLDYRQPPFFHLTAIRYAAFYAFTRLEALSLIANWGSTSPYL